MSAVTELVFAHVIDDLWGAGYTILPRLSDPYEVPPRLIPHGMAYQWNGAPDTPGWKPVPYERHDGYYAPCGTGGDCYVMGLWLCERPAIEVAAAKEAQQNAARKQVSDWAERNKEFTGGARTVEFGEGEAFVTEIETGGDATTHVEVIERPRQKTVELTTAIPPDLFFRMDELFAERDRLKEELVLPDRSLRPGEVADKFYAAIEEDKSAPWWPTLHAILLPIAIENVRKGLKREITS